MGVSRRHSIMAQYKYSEADGTQVVFTNPFSGAYSLPELKFFGASFQASAPTVSAPAAIVSLDGVGSITDAQQSVGASVDISLKGISVYRWFVDLGYIPSDAALMAGVWDDGKKYWIGDTDEPDVEVNGVRCRRCIRRINQITFDGTENIHPDNKWSVYLFENPQINANYDCRAYRLGSHGGDLFGILANGVGLAWANANFGCSTTEDFKAFLAAQYAAGTPMTCQYILQTPIVALSPPVSFPAAKGENRLSISGALAGGIHAKYLEHT